jgi:MYXO-CTERM domain-containing protein
MKKIGTIAVAAACLAASAGAASAQVNMPFSITGSTMLNNNQNVLSGSTVAPAATIPWTVTFSTLQIQGNLGFGNTPMPLVSLGLSPTELVQTGVAFGPGTLMNKNFTLGTGYNFNVKLDLMADMQVKSTVTVNSLGVLPVGTAGSPLPIQVTAVDVAGTAQVGAVPSPGPAALMGAGGLLMVRRRRKN